MILLSSNYSYFIIEFSQFRQTDNLSIFYFCYTSEFLYLDCASVVLITVTTTSLDLLPVAENPVLDHGFCPFSIDQWRAHPRLSSGNPRPRSSKLHLWKRCKHGYNYIKLFKTINSKMLNSLINNS